MTGITISTGKTAGLGTVDAWRDSGDKGYETLRHAMMAKCRKDWSNHPFKAVLTGVLGLRIHDVICDWVTDAVRTQISHADEINNSSNQVKEIAPGILCGAVLVQMGETPPVWMVIIASKDGAVRFTGQRDSSTEDDYTVRITYPPVQGNESMGNLETWMGLQFADCHAAREAKIMKSDGEPVLQWLLDILDGSGLQDGRRDMREYLREIESPSENPLFPQGRAHMGWPDALRTISNGLKSSPPNEAAISVSLKLMKVATDERNAAMKYAVNTVVISNDTQDTMHGALKARLPEMTENNLSVLMDMILTSKLNTKDIVDLLQNGVTSLSYQRAFGLRDENIPDSKPLPPGVDVDYYGGTMKGEWGKCIEGVVVDAAVSCFRNQNVRTAIGRTGNYTKAEEHEAVTWIRQTELFGSKIKRMEELSKQTEPTWGNARELSDKIRSFKEDINSIKFDSQRAENIR